MAQILTTLVEGDAKLVIEIRREGVMLAQAVLTQAEVTELIDALVVQRSEMVKSARH